MKCRTRFGLPVWLLLLAAAAWLTFHHLPVSTDLSAFLPAATQPRQQAMMDQLQRGAAARILLIGLTGADPQHLAMLDRVLTQRLQGDARFTWVNNGAAGRTAADLALLDRDRYLLSDAITPARFRAAALHARLEGDLALLGGPDGDAVAQQLTQDPTGELRHILAPLQAGGPHRYHGLWFSPDQHVALIMAQTAASGLDPVRQQAAVTAVRQAFAAGHPAPQVRLLITGPGAFAAQSRQIIERESRWLSVATGLIVLLILYAVYRSPRLILLSYLPALTGLVAGVAAVRLAFGSVHGITLGFAAILIGEAVDYPGYLFTHIRPGETARAALGRIRPTLHMAVLTTVCGVAAMLLSSFTGLMQLGLLTAIGVLVAGVLTQTALPALLPAGYRPPAPAAGWLHWPDRLQRLPGRRWLAAGVTAAAAAGLLLAHGSLVDDDLAHLNPLPASALQLDQQLRADLGAPDVRYLLVLQAPTREAVLQQSEALAPVLDAWVAQRLIRRYDLAARWLPSARTQRARQAALPVPAQLARNLQQALGGLPFRPAAFQPFLADVATARQAPPLRLADLRGTDLQMKVQTLLYPTHRGWVALAPLSGIADPARLAAAAQRSLPRSAWLLDMKTESARMMDAYLSETLRLTGLGVAFITLVLAVGLRRLSAVAAVLAPVLAACCIDAALLRLAGERLGIFHLIALLLVVGVGINYALFFNLRQRATGADRTALSLAVCSLTALAAFGVLACSQTPVLHAIGLTVSLGVILSLLMAALTTQPPQGAPDHDPPTP